jgi:hypothetical protein
VIRRPLVLLLSVLIFLGAVGFLAYRPATITGVDAGELASSVEGTVGGPDPHARCQQVHGSDWHCSVSAGAGASAYRVAVHSFGCWEAKAAGGSTQRLPRRPSGCITALDYF